MTLAHGGSPWPIRANQSQVIKRPRCPVCGSTDIETYSVRQRPKDRTIRYCRCRECHDMRTRRPTCFKVVVE